MAEKREQIDLAELAKGPKCFRDTPEVFENEPGDRHDELCRNMTEEEVDDLVERHERALAGDEDAWFGWKLPDN